MSSSTVRFFVNAKVLLSSRACKQKQKSDSLGIIKKGTDLILLFTFDLTNTLSWHPIQNVWFTIHLASYFTKLFPEQKGRARTLYVLESGSSDIIREEHCCRIPLGSKLNEDGTLSLEGEQMPGETKDLPRDKEIGG